MHYDRIHLVRIFKPNHGGMELIVNEIATIQKKLGLKVAVVTSGYYRDAIDLKYKEKLKVYRLPYFLFKGIILPKVFKKNFLKCKILHVHGMDPYVDITKRFIEHDELKISPHGGFFHTEKHKIIKKIYLKFVSKRLYKGVKSFCISYNDMQLSEKFESLPVYMGCGFEKRNLEINKNAKDTLIFGRISKNKRVDSSIEVSKTLFPNNTINVVGHDEIGLMNKYDSENLIYHGILDNTELKILSKSCRYFIMMSSYEGLGMTLIEALYSGFICIVSDITSFRLLCDQLDSKLIKKFVVFVKDKNQKISIPNYPSKDEIRMIRKNIIEVFSWKNAAQIIEG